MNAELEQVSNIEWLGQHMRAKAVNYEIETKSKNLIPITFEDRCGAIASIDCEFTKAYCELLVWGDSRDNTQAFQILNNYFTNILFDALNEDIQRKRFDLKLFCSKVAKMTIFFNLRPQLKGHLKVKHELQFFGITEVTQDTYVKNYKYLENMVVIMLSDMVDEIDFYVEQYRKDMRKISG